MSKKFSGKFEAFHRVGLRDKETKDLISVYPKTVEGTDEEIENKVKSWYSQKSPGAESRVENYYVDTLSPMEFKNAKEKFTD
jgi:hypothetical protein